MESLTRTLMDHLLQIIDEGSPIESFSKARVAFNLVKMINDLRADGLSDKEISIRIVDYLIAHAADTTAAV